MTVNLTLQEKLRDLRDERKLTINELYEKTFIPASTLQRLESGEDVRVGYQDLKALAEFYEVSTDYLFGLTDNRLHINSEISALGLSDSALEVLLAKKINSRLLSEMISHWDFNSLMTAVEIYLDRTISPQLKSWNAVFELSEQKVRENYKLNNDDKFLDIIREVISDEDAFLLNKVTERFKILLMDLYREYKNNAPYDEQTDVIKILSEDLDGYIKSKEKPRAKLNFLAKQIGLNTKHLSEDELKILMKAIQKSDKYRNFRGKRK